MGKGRGWLQLGDKDTRKMVEKYHKMHEEALRGAAPVATASTVSAQRAEHRLPPISGPYHSNQVVVGASSIIPVDTSLPTKEFLNDLRKTLLDNARILQRDLKTLADEYEAREEEYNKIVNKVSELEKCIEALDNG